MLNKISSFIGIIILCLFLKVASASASSVKEDLKYLEKAYSYLKTEDYNNALKKIKKAPTTYIDDLKYYIKARASRLYAEDLNFTSNRNDPLKHINDSIAAYSRLILEYQKSPFYSLARDELLLSKILKSKYYFVNGKYAKSAARYNAILMNYEGKLTKWRTSVLLISLGDSYYKMKRFSRALKAYRESATLYGSSKDLIAKIENLSGIIKESSEGPKLYSETEKETQDETTGLLGEHPEGKDSINVEEALFEKANKQLEDGSLENSIGSFYALLMKYPGTKFFKESREKLKSALNGMISRAKKRFPWGSHHKNRAIDDRTLSYINNLDLELRIECSSALYRSEFLRDVSPILESILKDHPYSDFAPRALLILSRIYRVADQSESAIRALDKLYNRYTGSDLNKYSLFKTGLIYYGIKDFKKALYFFKKYLKEGDRDSQSRALFWVARSQRALGVETTEYTERLKAEFPLSFYSVIEDSYSHMMKLASSPSTPYLTNEKYIRDMMTLRDNVHFKRALSFMYIGLNEYSDYELRNIDKDDLEVKIYLSYIFSRNGSHRNAIWLAAESAVEKPQVVNLNLLKILFPRDNLPLLIENGRLYGLDHILLLSLIKQESAFDTDAVSRSGALGLMQLMPFTANDVSARLRLSKEVNKEKLEFPQINIALGTYYFYKVLENLDGNAIYALASYNAGPSRVKEWIAQNRDMTDMEFMEQIPVGETNGYVKNIARNYIFYSYLLDKRLATLNDLKSVKYNDSTLVNLQ